MEEKVIALLCATHGELNSVLPLLAEAVEHRTGHLRVFTGIAGAERVVLTAGGVGKVNTAVAATLLSARFDLKQLINFGSAGAVNPAYKILDLFVPRASVQHDIDLTAFGAPRGHFSSDAEMHTPVDGGLYARLTKACGIHRTGILASGDAFIHSARDNSALTEVRADACDMEGAACAQACNTLNIPFAALKVISDTMSGEEYEVYASTAEQKLLDVFRRFFGISE